MSTVPAAGPDGAAKQRQEHLVRFLAEAAMRAPSVHHNQPWRFEFEGSRISLYADLDRWLETADPDGREMLISCGAALFTLRLAARHLGYEPVIREFPDPEQPYLVAELVIGRQVAVSDEDRRLYRQIWRRRAYRGAFCPDPLPDSVLYGLGDSARCEGAVLRPVVDVQARRALAALTEAAEEVQRLDPAYDAEFARWTAVSGTDQETGAHVPVYWRARERAEPHYPMREQGPTGERAGDVREPAAPWTHGEHGPRPAVTGFVAVLTTCSDTRSDWLRAGQALQRVSLHACAHGLSAAHHGQPLEVPELREFVRGRFCEGGYPQLLLRLGRSNVPAVGDGAEDAGVRTAAGGGAGAARTGEAVEVPAATRPGEELGVELDGKPSGNWGGERDGDAGTVRPAGDLAVTYP